MKLLSRIWNDIRQGENIDLYLTIFAAFSIVALNLLGLTSETLIAPLTLAILGLLAISSLENRHRSKKLYEEFSKSINSVFLSEFPSSVNNEIDSARELWLIGVTLNRTIKTYYSMLEQKLSRGHIVKVLLVHPESAAAQMEEEKVYESGQIDRKRRDIINTLQDLCQLSNNANGNLEIRVLRHPLAFGARYINPGTASSVLYIEHYPYKTRGVARPIFILKAIDGQWYDSFAAEIEMLWRDGIEWACAK